MIYELATGRQVPGFLHEECLFVPIHMPVCPPKVLKDSPLKHLFSYVH